MSQARYGEVTGAVDLHCHSTASDGFLSPSDLVAKALSTGLQAMALTDHDTVEGVAEAQAAASGTSLEVIPGIELSSNSGPNELHLLGYFVDPSSSRLNEHSRWCQRKRVERIGMICKRLTDLGLPIPFEEVQDLSGEGSIGRPHVAQAMISHGYVDTIGEAFNRYLGIGRPGYVPRENVPPAEAIGIINEAKGVAVMAHPLSSGEYWRLLPDLRDVGLAGLEAYYGEYDQATRERLVFVARQYGLIPTGGSDYHGDGFKEGRGLGSVVVPLEVVDELRSAARE